MNKIKVVGEFPALQAYIDGFPDFANSFSDALDTFGISLTKAAESLEFSGARDQGRLCREVYIALGDATLETDFRPILARIDALLQDAIRFRLRSTLEASLRDLKERLDETGQGPQHPSKSVLFEPVSEEGLLDRTGYNPDEDKVLVLVNDLGAAGLQTLARLLPYVNSENALLVRINDGWNETAVEDYADALRSTFENKGGAIIGATEEEFPRILAEFATE